MYSYNRKSIVSNSEIQALKEVIFERARERAEAMANSAQNQYTSSFKAEIMEIARNSFNSPSNPFAQNSAQPIKNDPATEAKPKIGFPEWGGNCSFGDWEKGFVIRAENFRKAMAGDKLEFLFTTDKSKPEVNYWLFKTIYSGTDKTLSGNKTEQNKWGCVNVGERSTVYRITLTAEDVVNLQKSGLFVNGYYNIVTRCNLLRKMPKEPTEQMTDEQV